MKILVLAPQWPDPPRQGAAIRNLHVLLHLSMRHDVTLFTFAPDGGRIDLSRLAGLTRVEVLPAPVRSHRDRLHTLFFSGDPDLARRLGSVEMRERLTALCAEEQFDAVHIEGVEMAPYGLLAQTSQPRPPRLTYDAHNAEFLLQRRAFTTDLPQVRQLPRALYSLVQWWRLRRFERRLCMESAHILAVSESDLEALQRLAPGAAARTRLLPNGVDTQHWSPGAGDSAIAIEMLEDALVFDGTMDFRPNVDAVVWFVREVLPLIQAERPSVPFFIVGRNPAPAVQALARVPGVVVTGAVDDPRPWVAGAAVYVVPMRMGGGVRLKVLQAMAMERAIVSTPMGAEGVHVRDGRDMIIAATPTGFARSVVSLLSDPHRRQTLGTAARASVMAHYEWSRLLPILDDIYA